MKKFNRINKVLNALFILIILNQFSCTTKSNEVTSSPVETEKLSEEGKEVTSGVQNDSASPAPTIFQDIILLINKEDVLIPPANYQLLGLEVADGNLSEEIWSLSEVKKISDTDYLLVAYQSENGGCNDITCFRKISLVLFNEERIISAFDYSIAYQTWRGSKLLNNSFLLIETEEVEYQENESGIMVPTDEVMINRMYTVVTNDRIASLESFTKEELKLCRNTVFAKYGYKFKDEKLSAYFSKFNWYKPTRDNVDAQLTGDDKNLVQYIRSLEDSK
ncbi:MAG: YARHG domain-containing protein [Cyclobacteriaceae bacterium]